MRTSSFKKEKIWFLKLFILIFAAVFSAVTILDISKNIPTVDSFVFSVSKQAQQKQGPQCIPTEKLDPFKQLQCMIDAKSSNPMENIALTLLLEKVRSRS